jgi:hypothetical protein
MKYSLAVKTKKKPIPRICDFQVIFGRYGVTMQSENIKIETTKYALDKILNENRCITPKDCFVFEENGVDQTMSKYEHLALLYAEKYGIIEYTVKGSKMIYYVNYKEYAHQVKNYKGDTYKAVVNLKTGEETRTLLKRYNPIGWNNR